MRPINDYQLMQDISKLYFENNFNQNEIAQRYNISRPKVSRILARAKEEGIVKIFIDNKADQIKLLENKLNKKFSLKALKVVSTPDSDSQLSLQMTARAASDLFVHLFEPGDKIGVSWGYTIYTMANYFPDWPLDDCSIHQITGSIASASTRSRAGEIVRTLGAKLHTQNTFTLPCPAMLDSPLLVDMLLHDSKLKDLIQRIASCNKLIVSLASAKEECCLYQSGYLRDEDLAILNRKNAAGSICCRFINHEGKLCDESIDGRTFGITLDQVRGKDYIMTIVASPKKVPVLHAALRAGYINVLVIDSLSAAKLLNFP